MQIKETVVVERELHVAPCIECGHEDIHLSDSNYSSFNVGGGKCKNCNHQSTSSVGIFPTSDEMAAIWNAENDINFLIAAEEKKIAVSKARISELKKLAAKRKSKK